MAQTVLDIRFLLFAAFYYFGIFFDVFIQKSKSVYPVVHFEVTADHLYQLLPDKDHSDLFNKVKSQRLSRLSFDSLRTLLLM